MAHPSPCELPQAASPIVVRFSVVNEVIAAIAVAIIIGLVLIQILVSVLQKGEHGPGIGFKHALMPMLCLIDLSRGESREAYGAGMMYGGKAENEEVWSYSYTS